MAKSRLRAAVISLVMILSGISNQMAFYTAGQLMSGFPMFLLYFCNGVYALSFFVALAISQAFRAADSGGVDNSDSDSTKASPLTYFHRVVGDVQQHTYFAVIGLLMGLELEMIQFANGKVIADLQSCLYQLYLPATALCSMVWLRKRLTKWQISGCTLVFLGCLIAIAPGGIEGASQLIWIIVYAVSSLPLGFSSVLQEEAFHKLPRTGALQMTAWSSVYAVLFFLLSLPIIMVPGLLYDNSGEGPIFPHGASWAQMWENQSDAMSCFLGHTPLPRHCGHGAARPVLVYAFSYGLNVYSCMMLVQEVDAMFVPVVGSFFVPGVAVASAIPAIVELYGMGPEDVTPITWYMVLGTIVLTLGLFAYEADMFKSRLRPAKRSEEAENDSSDDESGTDSEDSA